MASVDNVYDIAPINKYVASSGQTVFDYDFPIFDAVDLRVYVGDVLQSIGTDYTVQGEGNENGGTVTFTSGRSSGQQITIYRLMPIERLTDMAQNGPMRAADFNQELDRITMYLQEVRRDMDRSLRFGILGNSPSPELSPIDNWKDRYLYVNSSGALQPSVNIGTTPLSQSVIGELLYPITGDEASAGIVPANQAFPVGNVLRYGADPTGTADSTFAIQSAIDVGQAVIFPAGEYLAAGLQSSTNFQQFIAVGDAWIYKNANGPIWTVNGRECLFERIKFNGRSASFSGDNLIIDASNCTLSNCGSRDAAGRAVLSTSGDNLRIIGTSDIYQTADQSPNSYDIELRGGGLYSRIIAITSSQHAGGILFDSANTASVIGCQVGKITTINNGSVFLSASRVHTLLISGSNCTFSGNAIASSVVLGPDGVIVGGLEWSSSNALSSSATFTVGENVRFSTLHLESVQEAGATISIHPTAEEWNYITSSPETYAPTISSAGGDASIGDGTFSKARFSRNGRRVSVDVEFIFGGTTSFGSGAIQVGLPFPVSSSVGGTTVGTALASDATGVHYVLIANALPGNSFVTFYADGVGNDVSGTTPFAWASPDRLRFSIEYPVSA